MQDFKDLKKIIEKNQNIVLLPSPELQNDSFPASLALFYSLKKLGKNVNLIYKHLPEKFNFLIKKDKFQTSEADFLISIKESGIKLSQIFYEKTEDNLNLYLKTNGGKLKKENITLKSLDSKPLLITIGIEGFDKVKDIFKKEKLESIINIDNNPENKKYGEINLIETHYPSFSEIIFDFLQAIDENLFDIDVSNSIAAGIIQGTSNFQDIKLNSKTFQKLAFLMEKGVNFQQILSNFYRLKTNNSFRLFRRVLNKLKFSNEKNIGWVTLEENDFREIKSSPSELPFTFEKLTCSIFPFQNFLCLWESKSSPTSVRGVFYSPNKKILEKILENFAGEQKGNGILFQVKEIDIQKVKDDILEIL